MKKDSLLSKLREYGLHSKEAYMAEAFSRNIGLLTRAEQDELANATVAIAGMGGVGGVHLITMVRTGVCKFHLADYDTFEPVNVNRQYGARIPDFGRSKLEVMVEEALSINPYLEIKQFPEGITSTNVDDFLDGVEVVLDGLDFFNFEMRRFLFNRAREKGVYVVTAGPMGFSSAVLIFSPHKGMGFDEYFNIYEGMTPPEKYLSYGLGLAPRATHIRYMDPSRVDLESEAGPSLGIACQLCSGMAATEAIRIILKKGRIRPVPHFLQFDPYVQKCRKGKLRLGNRNPIQRVKMWVVKKMLERKKTRLPSAPPSPPRVPKGKGEIPEEVIRFLVAMGTWAPSADNCQPWKFRWDGKTLTLLKDPKRTGFFYDVNNESTLMTFGAVIENIRIAATHYGLEASVELPPDPATKDDVAEMSFTHTGVEEDPLFAFLWHRCVNRKLYLNKPIGQDTIAKLNDVVHETAGADLVWIEDETSKKKMMKIIFDADRILFEDQRLHNGLFRWMRMGKGAFAEPDGLNLDVLELNWFQRKTFPLLSNWRTLSWLNKLGVSRIAAMNSMRLLKRSAAHCLLTIDERSPSGYFYGGRMMERFWIKANAQGLSLQPMAGFIFLLNHLSNDGAVQFRPNHRVMIEGIQTTLESIFQGEKSRIPLMFFRLGYGEPPSSRSPRRQLAEILEEA